MVRAGDGFLVAGSALAPRVLRQTHPSVIRDPPQAAVPTARLGVAILARSSQPAGGWRPTARGHRTARLPRGFPPSTPRATGIVDSGRSRRFRETRSGAPIGAPRAVPVSGWGVQAGRARYLGSTRSRRVSRAGRPALCGTGPRRGSPVLGLRPVRARPSCRIELLRADSLFENRAHHLAPNIPAQRS